MRWLVSTSLQIRLIVVALALILLSVGGNTTANMPMDVFPEFAPPRVEVQTEVPGLSAQEVESLVTVPIENALNGTSYMTTLRSRSVLGLSSVLLIFENGTDIMLARQLVQERLALATRELPLVADPPVILSPLSSTSRILKIGMQSETFNQMQMTELALWTVRPRLMAIPGVANVAIWGQRDRQFQVQVDPDRLRAHDLSIQNVVDRTKEATTIEGGGFVEGPNQRFNVTHMPAVRTTGDLAEHRGGFPQRHAASARRRGRRGRRLPARDRRRHHQRQARLAADRREAALGQHARDHAQHRIHADVSEARR